MPSYDFTALSPIDFEMLVRDLLQAELKLRFETFKPGVDQGIDLRYSQCRQQPIIVQCKHYAGSTFRHLLNHLSKDEFPKIYRLSPRAYILATSIALNPAQKDKILQLLRPFVRNPSDIFGREDLNNLLQRHPRIEKQTFKLWFSSTAIFEEMLDRKVKNISRDAVDKIRDKSKFYVQSASFSQAQKILQKNNFCIITGIPGIGKTTLAEMLILHYVQLGYDFIKIESDISEARSIDYASERRLFYYDDFLGQASFSEKFNKNEDQKLLDFLHAIRRSKVSRMILTTREYILNQARLRYEKIDRSKFELETCVVDMAKYTRLIRGQILYNHVYFSQLPKTHKKALLGNARYREIIDHTNYSPRIIELMTDIGRVKSISPRSYISFFLNNLEDPFEIWRHAFEQQLSREAKHLLLILTTLPAEAAFNDVQSAFDSFHGLRAREFNFELTAEDFKRSLKELDGNFIKTEKDAAGHLLVSFHNPSVRDFMQNRMMIEEADVVSLIKAGVFIEQLIWLWNLERASTGAPGLRPIILSNAQLFTSALKRTIDARGWKIRYRWAHGEWRFDPLSLEERLAFISRFGFWAPRHTVFRSWADCFRPCRAGSWCAAHPGRRPRGGLALGFLAARRWRAQNRPTNHF